MATFYDSDRRRASGSPDVTTNGRPQTLGEAIRRIAAATPDKIAIVSSSFAPFSYGQLAAELSAVAAALRGGGFARDARIGIALQDGPQAALAIVSTACSAVAVPINPDLTMAEIAGRLRLVGVDALIVFRRTDSAARAAAEQCGVPVIEAAPTVEGGLSLAFAVPRAGRAEPPSEPDPKAPAVILQTSGTTAEPNLIPYSHSNMLATAARVKRWFNLASRDRCLSITPAHYCHGLTLTIFAPLLSGGSVAFPESPFRPDIDEWFRAMRPTWLSAGPTMHLMILEKICSDARQRLEHDLRFVVSGGAPLPLNVQMGLEANLEVPVLEHYGATEVGQLSANLPPPGPAKAATCGIPDPNTAMIISKDGTPLGPNERGEILLAGPTVISEYLNAPELNKSAFVKGWFRSGDIGSIDEEGFLTLHGRLKEVINRGGEKISPMEIDVALLSHPAVAKAAAFSVPHPRLGEDVAAAVVLRMGAAATPDELRHFLGTRLAWFKVPRRITIVQNLPTGSTGKVQRRKLRESYR
jgi:acyl-CoA synthetase (AMP-forming)/AMP-acid ligase II